MSELAEAYTMLKSYGFPRPRSDLFVRAPYVSEIIEDVSRTSFFAVLERELDNWAFPHPDVRPKLEYIVWIIRQLEMVSDEHPDWVWKNTHDRPVVSLDAEATADMYGCEHEEDIGGWSG